MDKLEINDIQSLLGLPWERGAEGPKSYDCWGLVKHCLQKIGIEVKLDVDYDFPKGMQEEFNQSLAYWVELPEPEDNCIIYGYKGGLPCHIGFVIDNWVFHALGEENNSGYVVMTKLKTFKRLYSDVRFFKWQK